MTIESQYRGVVVTCGDYRLHESVRWYMRDRHQILKYYLYALPGSFLPAHKQVEARASSEFLTFKGHFGTYLKALAGKQTTGPLCIFAFYHVSTDGRHDDCAGWCKLNGLVGLHGEDCWREAACGLETMAEEIAGALGRKCEVVLHQAFLSDERTEDIRSVENWDVLPQPAA